MIGVLKFGRRFIPDELKMTKKQAKKLAAKEFREHDGEWVLTQLYVDNTPVLLLSTHTDPGDTEVV